MARPRRLLDGVRRSETMLLQAATAMASYQKVAA